MTAAAVLFVVVVSSALILQLTFSVLYWVWIPSWIRHPYGRLAQLGSFSHILLLSLYIFFVLFGALVPKHVGEAVLISGFFPLVFFSVMQLILLKRAVDSSKEQRKVEARNDS